MERSLGESLLQAVRRLDRIGSPGGHRLAEALVRRDHEPARIWLAAALLKGGASPVPGIAPEVLVARRPRRAWGGGPRRGPPARGLPGVPGGPFARGFPRTPPIWKASCGGARPGWPSSWAGAYRDYERAVSAWGASLVPYVGLSLALLGQGREPGGIDASSIACGRTQPRPRDGRRAAALWKVLRGLEGTGPAFPAPAILAKPLGERGATPCGRARREKWKKPRISRRSRIVCPRGLR